MELLKNIFGTHSNLAAGQECARAAVIFLYGLAMLRLTGRRTFGKWSALDITVSIIVGSSLSRALTGNAPLGGTLLAAALLMTLHWLFAFGAARSSFVSRVVEGRAVVLADAGCLDERTRIRHALSPADLHEALRAKNVEHVSQTSRITLEPSGKINVQTAKS